MRRSGGFVEPRGAVTVDEAGEAFTLDNGILRAVLGRDGTLRSLVVGGREAMAAPGNVLELYDDRPTDFEAWDLDPFHLETRADCPPADARRGRARRSAARRGRVRAPDRRAQPHAPDGAARRRGAAARVPLRDRLAARTGRR